MTSTTFEQLNLSEFIQKAISDLEFTVPTAIQAEAIPHLMNNEDIVAMAPTGSGKTFAFAIPALQKIEIEDKSIQVLILCPTRELTIQAHSEIEKLSKYNEEIKTVSIYGGQQISKQINALKRNPQIVIATPGRLMDHLRQNNLNLNNLKYIVLDEADEMLDMGFRDDIHTILEQTNQCHQTVLFSATMEKGIQKIAERFQTFPIIIDVLDNLQNAPDIEQYYLEVSENDKAELITRLLSLYDLDSALVFCNTKSSVDKLVETLKTKSFLTDAIHGDLNQSQREKVMKGFKKGSVKVLVATDVAGRGIDVKDIEAVFNYDLPRDDEDYIHRIGRTGRAGKSGKAFSLVTKRQLNSLRKIEQTNGLKINKRERPTIEEIEAKRINNYKSKISEIIKVSDLSKFQTVISELVNEGISELDIASALFKILNQKEQVKINEQIVFEETNFNYNDEPKKIRRDRDRSRTRSTGENRDRSRTRSTGENRNRDRNRSENRGFSKKSYSNKGEIDKKTEIHEGIKIDKKFVDAEIKFARNERPKKINKYGSQTIGRSENRNKKEDSRGGFSNKFSNRNEKSNTTNKKEDSRGGFSNKFGKRNESSKNLKRDSGKSFDFKNNNKSKKKAAV